MNEQPRCNEAGLAIIKDREELFLNAYLCPAKVWTIGWGHTRGVKPGMVCTREQAEAWLQEDIAVAEEAVDRLVDYHLSNNQFSALCSFVFNIGETQFAKSAVLRDINNGDFDDVPAHMALWKFGGGQVLKGLIKRRRMEGELWEMPDPEPDDDVNPELAA